jgi:hypothetical protein
MIIEEKKKNSLAKTSVHTTNPYTPNYEAPDFPGFPLQAPSNSRIQESCKR